MSPRRRDEAAVGLTDEVPSHPDLGVRNSQPEGIGRVAALSDVVGWNNLGRNVVFADRRFRPLGIFDDTSFPDDDELSQYDLDIHAIVELREAGLVGVLNHLGWLRAFRTSELTLPGPTRPVRPVLTTFLVEDVERIVAAGTQLIGSRPRSDGAGGLLVSEPIHGRGGPRLDADVALDSWGEVTALGTLGVGRDQLIALGGEGRAALVPLANGKIGRPRWEVDLGFRAASFAWDGRLVWMAGSELTPGSVDDHRWEDLRGGGFAALDPSNGQAVVVGRLPDDVAWGNGGVAVVVLGGVLCAVGRTGGLHLLCPSAGGEKRLTATLSPDSLGIAHAAAVGDRVLYGFNRGGYRLHTFRPASMARTA